MYELRGSYLKTELYPSSVVLPSFPWASGLKVNKVKNAAPSNGSIYHETPQTCIDKLNHFDKAVVPS